MSNKIETPVETMTNRIRLGKGRHRMLDISHLDKWVALRSSRYRYLCCSSKLMRWKFVYARGVNNRDEEEDEDKVVRNGRKGDGTAKPVNV